jgi:aminoglycoside phosphotransferase (APT) family kinase protein
VAPILTGEDLDEPALGPAIAAIPGWEDEAEIKVALLTAGITNRNYLLQAGGERVVVRVFGADTGLLGIDREAEEVAARSAAAAGVGPQVVAFLPEAGCLVSRFVQGATVPEEDLRRPHVIKAVVRSVRAIHACDPIPSAFPVFRVIEDYADLARARGVGLPSAYDEARSFAARIEAAFARAPMPSRTCHNDLLNANFLDGRRICLDPGLRVRGHG